MLGQLLYSWLPENKKRNLTTREASTEVGSPRLVVIPSPNVYVILELGLILFRTIIVLKSTSTAIYFIVNFFLLSACQLITTVPGTS